MLADSSMNFSLCSLGNFKYVSNQQSHTETARKQFVGHGRHVFSCAGKHALPFGRPYTYSTSPGNDIDCCPLLVYA